MFDSLSTLARGRVLERFVFTLSCGIGALGCGGGLRTQAEGGLPWREYNTAHFVLRTDAETAKAVEVARHLEDIFHVLGHVAFPYEPPFEGTTEVVLFSEETDLSLIHLDVDGVHKSGAVWIQTMPSIVVAGRAQDNLIIVTHELVHRFVTFNVPQAPIWLNEGLAKYYETLRVEDKALIVGEHPLAHQPRAQFRLSADELLPVADLRSLDKQSFYDTSTRDRNYMSAWTLINAFQFSARRPAFVSYLDALQSGAITEAQAFREHLQGQVNESLARDRGAVLERTGGEVSSFNEFRRPEPPPWTSKPMPPAAVHALWARLLDHQPESSVREARRALELDPENPEASLLLGVVDADANPGLVLERLWTAYEKSGRASRYGAVLLRLEGVEDPRLRRRLDEVARKLTKDATTSLEFEALGVYLLRAGRTATAEKYAEQAVRSDPSNARAYGLLARIAATKSDYARALHFQTWSVNLSSHEVAQEELGRLQEYESKVSDESKRTTARRE